VTQSIQVRPGTATDLAAIMQVHRTAFASDEEAQLVHAILEDESALPCLSLVAEDAEGRVSAHVLFSRVRLDGDDSAARASILCPLAVAPAVQKHGMGGALIKAGLEQLAQTDTQAVFVYGDPAYYTRFGFVPAIPRGLPPPYPIPDAYKDAWMVIAPGGGDITVSGQLHCCAALSDPKFW